MLGKYLKNFREKHEISQSEIYQKMGITKGYYSRIENNLLIPKKLKLIEKLVHIIECDPYYFVKIKDFYLNEKEKELEQIRDVFDKS